MFGNAAPAPHRTPLVSVYPAGLPRTMNPANPDTSTLEVLPETIPSTWKSVLPLETQIVSLPTGTLTCPGTAAASGPVDDASRFSLAPTVASAIRLPLHSPWIRG